MQYETEIAKIKEILDKATSVLVVTHEHATPDSMGSALALYLGLTAMGKKVTIAAPEPMTVELSNFVGANKVVTEVGKKNFIISLDYVEGSIEKVSYNIEGNKFNLVIEPRPGFESFAEDKVHFQHVGTAADVVIAVDTIHLGGLKKLYEEDKDLFATKPVINIDRHPNNVQYGQVNMIDTQASSVAEMVFAVLNGLGVNVTQDMATNLLNAVYAASNNFTSNVVTVNAFELATACMKLGARRFRRITPPMPVGAPFTTPPAPVVQNPMVGAPSAEEVPMQEAAMTSSPEIAQSTGMSPVTPQMPKKMQEAPSDWLKPKIFKSSNLL